MSDLDDSLEANSPNPSTYQARDRFPQRGQTLKVAKLVSTDSTGQMAHVLRKCPFIVPPGVFKRSIDLFLHLCV